LGKPKSNRGPTVLHQVKVGVSGVFVGNGLCVSVSPTPCSRFGSASSGVVKSKRKCKVRKSSEVCRSGFRAKCSKGVVKQVVRVECPRYRKCSGRSKVTSRGWKSREAKSVVPERQWCSKPSQEQRLPYGKEVSVSYV